MKTVEEMMAMVNNTLASANQSKSGTESAGNYPPMDQPEKTEITSATQATGDPEGWGDVSKGDTVLAMIGEEEFTGTVAQTVRKSSTEIRVTMNATGEDVVVPRSQLKKIGGTRRPVPQPAPAAPVKTEEPKPEIKEPPAVVTETVKPVEFVASATVPAYQKEDIPDMSNLADETAGLEVVETRPTVKTVEETPAWKAAQEEAAKAMGLEIGVWKAAGTGEFLARCMFEWKTKGSQRYPHPHRQLAIESDEQFVYRMAEIAEKRNIPAKINGAAVRVLSGPANAFQFDGEILCHMDEATARTTKPGHHVTLYGSLTNNGSVIFTIRGMKKQEAQA